MARRTITIPDLFLCSLISLRIIFLLAKSSERELFLIGSSFFTLDAHELPASNSCLKNHENMDLRYRAPTNSTGKRNFDPRWIRYLCHFGLVERPTSRPVQSVSNDQPILVTAVSDNHFFDVMLFLTSVNATMAKEAITNVTVYFYDLGINLDRLEKIRKMFGHFLIIRPFQFHLYPPYVSKLKEYRWKPLVVADVLKEHDSIWWMDSSVRLFSIKNLSWYQEELRNCNHEGHCTQYPLTYTSRAGHSIYAATSPGMFDFFPMTEEDAKRTQMMGATVFQLTATSKVVHEVLKWWVLCALEKDCMAPAGHWINCNFHSASFRKTAFAGCNRYDQSALSILTSLANNFDESRYARLSECAFHIVKTQ